MSTGQVLVLRRTRKIGAVSFDTPPASSAKFHAQQHGAAALRRRRVGSSPSASVYPREGRPAPVATSQV